tara:strand:+ start:9631 stop:10665 length:1035 start_codon:yes stop_codon:yes gene_type:complete
MQLNKIRMIAGGAALALSLPATSATAGGGLVCTVVDALWQAGHSSAQAALITGVNTMAATIATQQATTNELLVAALGVSTKQESVNAERNATTSASAAKATSQVIIEQDMAEQIIEAHETYGPQGQMIGGCDVAEELSIASAATSSSAERASEILGSGAIDTVPGAGVTPEQGAARRMAYVDEPEAVSAIAFLDSDTSAEMKDAFMNNVIGLPLDPPDDMGEVDSAIRLMQNRRMEALRSAPITSLAIVRAANEASGHFDTDELTEDGDVESLIDATDYLLDMYGGGDRYETWSAALVTKSEVGLLKEIARLRSVSLMLSRVSQEGSDRRQAIIATLLAGAAVR